MEMNEYSNGINEEEKTMVPLQDEQPAGNPKLRPWQGVLVQAGFIGLFLTAGSYMQRNWGIPGLVGTELMFLIVAVIYCLARRVKLREMFPMHHITVAQFFGTILMAAAGFLLSMVALGISLVILPNSMQSDASGLNEFLFGSGMNYPLLILVVALLPGICEEAMERGAVLSHFRSIKKDWIIILIMGVFFGIMHMSPLRFLSTGVLGALLTYVVVKTDNILLSNMMHFLHNGVTVTISYLAQMFLKHSTSVSSASTTTVNGWSALGAYMVIGFAAPVLLVCAMMLLDRKNHKATRFAIAGGISAFMLFGGFMIMSMGMLTV